MPKPSDVAEAAATLVSEIEKDVASDASSPFASTEFRTLLDSLRVLIPDARAGGDRAESAANRIVDLTLKTDAARKWMGAALRGEAPLTPRSYAEPIAIDTNATSSAKFVCPQKDGFVYYRLSVGTPVPACPHDGSTLVRER